MVFLFSPTETALCGVSLRSFVKALVTFDVFYVFFGLGAVASSVYLAEPSQNVALNSLLVSAVAIGAVLGILGLASPQTIRSADFLMKYALTRFVRIAVSVILTVIALSQATETATVQVDAYVAASKSPISEDERQALIRQFTAALIGGLVTWELLTDSVSIYFAYITVSLAELVKASPVVGSPSVPLLV